jgi:hypothetical protein
MKKKAYSIILAALTVIILTLSLGSCDVFKKEVENPIVNAPKLSARITGAGYDFLSFTVQETASSKGTAFTYDVIGITLNMDGKVVQTAANPGVRKFSGLKDGTIYTIVITYKSSDSEEVKQHVITARTVEKKKPTVELSEFDVSPTSIKASLNITDNEKIMKSYTVELYDGENLVESRSDGVVGFYGIEPMKEYTLRVSAVLNRKDGKGDTSEIIFERRIKTPPSIGVNTVTRLSPDTALPGDDVILELVLDNSHGASVRSVMISGITYNAEHDPTTDTVKVRINNKDMLYSGETELNVERINAKHGVYLFSVTVSKVSASVFFATLPTVESITLVDESLAPLSWVFPSSEIYALITLKNNTGATLVSVTEKSSPVPRTDFIKIDDTRWLLKINKHGVVKSNTFAISAISYNDRYTSGVVDCSNIRELHYFALASDEVHYVGTAEDLKNMNQGYYYELTNDIDLAGMSWYGESFSGVFNANGYSVKNMSFSGEFTGESLHLGLFTRGSGLIANLTIENATISVNTFVSKNEALVFCGAVMGYASDLTLINCSVDEASSIKAIGYATEISCGGMVGIGTVRITDSKSSAQVTSGHYAGGLVGSGDVLIVNSYNNGSVSSGSLRTIYALGGLVGSGSGTVENSYNSGSITAINGNEACVGGIFGSVTNVTEILGSHNSGSVTIENEKGITSGLYCGGIVGHVSESLLVDRSYNEGNITLVIRSAYQAGAGGIIGIIDAPDRLITVANCYNAGVLRLNESSPNLSACAGIVAISASSDKTVISNCYNVGNCVVTSNSIGYTVFGGIVGVTVYPTDVSIIACFNDAAVEANVSERAFTLGILGFNLNDRVDIQNCYTTHLTNHTSDVKPCDSSALNLPSFYTSTLGWRSDVWDLTDLDVSSSKYPTLK